MLTLILIKIPNCDGVRLAAPSMRSETCQLNPGQREEANVCFNITASSQRGLGSGLTPGLTALPDHTLTDKREVYCDEKV